jgi:hypothetical protein
MATIIAFAPITFITSGMRRTRRMTAVTPGNIDCLGLCAKTDAALDIICESSASGPYEHQELSLSKL